METKILIIFFTIGLISVSPHVFGQEDLGLLVEQQQIIYEIGKKSDVHVKHVIETGAWSIDRPRIIEILPGTHSNLSVSDEDGDLLNFSYDGKTFEDSKFIILNQKSGNYDLIAEYDLENFMEMENGLWKKEFLTSYDVIMMFDDDIEYIFSNSRPVKLNDAKGINCVGCNMTLELLNNEKKFETNVLLNDKKFEISYLSNKKISQIEFNQNLGMLNFDVGNNNQIIIMKIPFELLLNPFEVYFTENDDIDLEQIDKIRKTEIEQEEEHASVSFRTTTEGIISISGSTIEQHQKKLEQIQSLKEKEIEKEIVEEKKGIAIPIPGQSKDIENGEAEVEEKPKFSFEEELVKQERNDMQDYTIVLVIIGVIVAIIIGVIIKIKKN